MEAPVRDLKGSMLEGFLIGISAAIIGEQFSTWSARGKAKAQRNIIDVLRLHFAGFSKPDIVQYMFTEASPEAIQTFFDDVVDIVPDMRLTDPKTGERFAPEIWDLRGALALPLNDGVEKTEREAIAKAVLHFGEGNYDECARVSGEGCSAFGKHLFYQLCLISHLRSGHPGAAESCFTSARTGLQHVPWHLGLIMLTFGQTSGIEVLKESHDDNGAFQVRVFEGVREYTEARMESAFTKLTVAKAMPQDLPFEYLMLSADLERLGRVPQIVQVTASPDANGVTPLHSAAESGHLEDVTRLVANGADINAKTFREKMTPLHCAVTSGNRCVIEVLLANGAVIDAEEARGHTPLYSAAAGGHEELVTLLLANRANANARNHSAMTPLHAAAGHGHNEVIRSLLAAAADANARDSHELTPLHYAVMREHLDISRQLLRSKADVNARAFNGQTALHCAAVKGNLEITKVLLQYGANVGVVDKKGQTPFDTALNSSLDPSMLAKGHITSVVDLLALSKGHT